MITSNVITTSFRCILVSDRQIEALSRWPAGSPRLEPFPCWCPISGLVCPMEAALRPPPRSLPPPFLAPSVFSPELRSLSVSLGPSGSSGDKQGIGEGAKGCGRGTEWKGIAGGGHPKIHFTQARVIDGGVLCLSWATAVAEHLQEAAESKICLT